MKIYSSSVFKNMPSPNNKEAFLSWQKEIDENYQAMRIIAYGTAIIILVGVTSAIIHLAFFV